MEFITFHNKYKYLNNIIVKRRCGYIKIVLVNNSHQVFNPCIVYNICLPDKYNNKMYMAIDLNAIQKISHGRFI